MTIFHPSRGVYPDSHLQKKIKNTWLEVIYFQWKLKFTQQFWEKTGPQTSRDKIKVINSINGASELNRLLLLLHLMYLKIKLSIWCIIILQKRAK